MNRYALALFGMCMTSWAVPAAANAGDAASPPAMTTDDRARFDAAIALHDRGQYDAAVAAFRDLLKANPDHPTLLCEMANSLVSSGKAGEAIPHAERGLEQPGANITFCSTVLGNALDLSGDLKKGEKVFRKAIKESPDTAMLHFNLGVNQSLQKEPGKAIEAYQDGLRLNPSHPGSWRALAMEWQGQKMRPQAFAAFARFLALEPTGKRAEQAAPQLEKLLFQGVENKGTDPATGKGNISVSIDPEAGGKGDEAGALNMSMSILAATRWIDEWEKRTDAEFFTHAFDDVLKIFEETDAAKKDSFWNGSVMPYFHDARAAGHMETLSWEVRRSTNQPEVTAWLQAHTAEVESFRAWSAAWKPPAAGRP
jgi:tetratricopeptide (TPR) repeat protein